jgi:hypothetical protein
MKIKVGTIIYIIDPKSKTVVPARVNEQVVSRTMQGESVTHNVELTSGKMTNLESLNAAYFNSLDDVSTYLLDRAKEIIDAGIKNAEDAATKKFHSIDISKNDVPDDIMVMNDVKVTLEDGRQVNVTMPPEFLNENIDH